VARSVSSARPEERCDELLHGTNDPISFEDALARAEEALKEEGFGVISRIDISETLKKKIGVDFCPYTILGACNSALAYEALQLEDKVGTMLTCNVVIQQLGPNKTEFAAIDPVASMQAIDNSELKKAAAIVREKLANFIERLG
jgi:uncharacterized protein (DUF302 family)